MGMANYVKKDMEHITLPARMRIWSLNLPYTLHRLGRYEVSGALCRNAICGVQRWFECADRLHQRRRRNSEIPAGAIATIVCPMRCSLGQGHMILNLRNILAMTARMVGVQYSGIVRLGEMTGLTLVISISSILGELSLDERDQHLALLLKLRKILMAMTPISPVPCRRPIRIITAESALRLVSVSAIAAPALC